MQPVNINLTTGEQNTSDNVDNSELMEFKNYIIKSNYTLEKDNKNYIKKIKMLENENSDKEAELDKLDERIRYMRGLLHNFNEIKKLQETVCTETLAYNSKYEKLYNKYYKMDTIIQNFLNIYFIILFGMIVLHTLFFSYYFHLPIIFYAILSLFSSQWFIKHKYIKLKLLDTKNKKMVSLNIMDNLTSIRSDNEMFKDKMKAKVEEIKKLEEACAGIDQMIDTI